MGDDRKKARAWVKSLGLSGRDALRIERALCTLADYEGAIITVGGGGGNFTNAHAYVCEVLRKIADAWQFGNLPDGV